MVVILINDEQTTFSYDKSAKTLADLASNAEGTQESVSPVHYYNRWTKSLDETRLKTEISIDVPASLIKPHFTNSFADKTETVEEAESSFEPIIIRIEYEIIGSYQGLVFLRTPSKNGDQLDYFQLTYTDPNPMNRIWMPCLESEEQKCLWDFEFSISTAAFDPKVLEKLHAASTGVLFRQFSTESRKIFHFKLDSAMSATSMAFAIGLFDSVKITLAPFAHAFCPIGMKAKLDLTIEFFNKAFGFYNWYLSTLFPFASYFLVFTKQAHIDSYVGANVGIMSSNLLHDATIIDQVYETRRLLAESLCAQYFGIKARVNAKEDAWLLIGFQKYLSALLLRVFHGKNDYKYTLKQDLERVLELEPGKPALYSTRIESDVSSMEWLSLKSRIVLCILERKLEKTGLQRVFMHLWSDLCEGRLTGNVLTTKNLFKSVKKMTGKDLRVFADQWIYGSGAPIFSCSFVYNRKKSSIELDLKQSTPGQPGKKYSGSLLIRVHEQEGVFDHSVHIDDLSHRIELPYHTKIRKIRKKRRNTAGSTIQEPAGEDSDGHVGTEDEQANVPKNDQDEATNEAIENEDNNLAITSETSPVSWIRLDPDMDWYCGTDLHQPDFMWMEQLENDRDVVGQHDAAIRLCRHPSEAAAEAFEKAALNWKFFYKVRIDALMGLVSCATEELSWLGLEKIWNIFSRKMGLERAGKHPIPKANNFENFSNYFLQKAIPLATSMIRDMDGYVPDRVISFLLDILRYNDNSCNTFSDNYYLASAIEALGTAIRYKSPSLPESIAKGVMDEFIRYIRLEQMIPFFRNTVVSSVLKVIPSMNQDDYGIYMVHGHYIQVRLAALEGLLKSAQALSNFETVFEQVVAFVKVDPSRKFILDSLKLVGKFARDVGQNEGLKPTLWGLVSCWSDENITLNGLKLLNSCYPPASDDLLEERVHEAATSTLPSAVPTAPIRFNMQVHELGGGSDEEMDEAQQPEAEEADWIKELAGEADFGKHAKSRPIPKLKIQPLALNRTISHHQYAEQKQSIESNPMMSVLQQIWDNYDSFPFRYPVDPSVPGYYAIIRNPMDLETIQRKLRELRYLNLSDFVRDLRLIFDNCFTFNQPGSLIYDQALRLRHFAYKTIKKAYPDQAKMAKKQLTASEPIVIIPDDLRMDRPTTAEVPKLKLSISMPSAVPVTNAAPIKVSIPKIVIPPPAAPSPVKAMPQPLNIEDILAKLKAHQHAYWFAQPIDPVTLGIPTYFDIIREPMDFETITKNLESGLYEEDPLLFKRHTDLVFSNAKLFNPANTLVHQHAMQLEKFFHRLWSKSSIVSSSSGPHQGNTPIPAAFPSSPVHQRNQSISSPTGGLKIKLNLGGPATTSATWESAARKVLELVSQHELSGPFLEPVDPIALGCPTYFDEISHPMDISTMRQKLARHEYPSAKGFMDDFRLIIKNCIKFNGKGSEIAKMASNLQAHFNDLCHQHKL